MVEGAGVHRRIVPGPYRRSVPADFVSVDGSSSPPMSCLAVGATLVWSFGVSLADKIGDGKVWVTPVETVVRIPTGAMGHDALWFGGA